MSYTQQNNSGSIFKNDRKTNEKQPDYSGTLTIEGKEMRIALWVKEGKKGKFFSVKLSEPLEKQPSSQPQEDGSNQDLPF